MLGICVRVLISTLGGESSHSNGHGHSNSNNNVDAHAHAHAHAHADVNYQHGNGNGNEDNYGNGVISKHHGSGATGTGTGGDIMVSLVSSSIVMCSNLCFSFYGLYQKLYRSSFTASSLSLSSSSSSSSSDDGINNVPQTLTSTSLPLSDYELQLRVHQIGVVILLIPFCMLEGSTFMRECLEMGLSIIKYSYGYSTIGRSDNNGIITDDD